ncbi:MAG TPA: thiamine diphosphokinase [Bacteroidales bacterium]|nr:thiamine diphosphokinase [Bacteroidales bacterium]HRW94913.1 thiamine diphosphokinase [Bacteroidales bacterium]
MTDRAVILAQGAYPSHPYPLRILQQAKVLVCTDGAVNNLRDRVPDIIVGDLDSLSGPMKKKYASCLIRNTDQNTNDLTKAVQYCYEKGFRHIAILGATGLREDHMLGNISLLGDYARMMDKVQMVTDCGTFWAYTDKTPETDGFMRFSIPCIKDNPVSFFGLNTALKLKVKGIRYPVENVVFDALWKATLNRCTGNRLEVCFRNGPLLIYMTHPTVFQEARDIWEE